MSAPASTRPTGITILSILAGLEGVVLLFSGFAVMGLGAVTSTGSATILGLAGLALGALWLALGWGFWTVKPWAWALGVVLAAAGIVLAVLTLIGANGGIINAILSVAFPAVVLYYLNQPGIKALFGR
jgi:hypothetical protein